MMTFAPMTRFVKSLAPVGLAALICAASPVAADEISLSALETYLNSFETAQTEFTQFNEDGTQSTGTLYIKRPGRIRFEYDGDLADLVMASGGQVAIFDGRSNQPPEKFPLNQTPLNLLLARQMNLSTSKMVAGKVSDGTTTSLIIQDPDHTDMGQIELIFTDNPVTLRQWLITDQGGGMTMVVLKNLSFGKGLRDILFNVAYESRQRGLTD